MAVHDGLLEVENAKLALVQRVAESGALCTSPRLSQLFLYLCERAIARPGEPIKECLIGSQVFGRDPHYDTSQDTIVRVQISKLRRKLRLHFLTDGITEPIVIELPKGSYTPVFLPRNRCASGLDAPEPDLEMPVAPAARPNWLRFWPVLVGLAVVVVAGWLIAIRWNADRQKPESRFWREALGTRRTNVVVSDGNLVYLNDLLNGVVSLSLYRSARYPENVLQLIPDRTLREAASYATRTVLTSIYDNRALQRLDAIASQFGSRVNIVHARDYRPLQVPENLILLGHRRANPWIELFEKDLNFRYEWLPDRRAARIVNVQPKPDEQAYYEGTWGARGYGVIAYLKAGMEHRPVVILTGTDMTAIDSMTRAMTEESLERILDSLNLAPDQPIPPFEVLFETRIVGTSPVDSKMVTMRVQSPRLGK